MQPSCFVQHGDDAMRPTTRLLPLLLTMPRAALPSATPARPPTCPPLVPSAEAQSVRLGSADAKSGTCPHCRQQVKRLTRHLRMCPTLTRQAAMASLPFYSANCNRGTDETFARVDPSELRALPDAQLVGLVLRMHATAFPQIHVQPLEVRGPSAGEGGAPADEESEDGSSLREDEKERHRLQCRAIAEQLQALAAVGVGHCHVEVGAGSAGVSLALACADEGRADSHVLLDQFLPRMKADKTLREMGAAFERHKLQLEHLDMARLQGLRGERGQQLTVVAKHLCGSATDYALRAVSRCPTPVAAFALASCCHHRCEIGSYPNRALFERSGIGHADFSRICRMTSWAVNGHGTPAQEDEEGGVRFEAPDGRALGRRELGRLCKDLLDAGRVLYLQAMGYDAWLAEYVSAELTPENVLIVARPPAAGQPLRE